MTEEPAKAPAYGVAREIVSRRVDAGGVQLEYLDAGPRDAARTILLLHGGGRGSASWKRVLPPLARMARVIAPDMVGFDRSERPDAKYSLPFFAASLDALIAALALGPVALVGHSVGGAVALRFALDHPERVTRIALLNGAGFGPELKLWARLGPILAMIAGRLTGRRVSPLMSRRYTVPWNQWMFQREELGRLAVPCLLIWGLRDRVFPNHHAELARSVVPGLRVEYLRRAGHSPHTERPGEVARLLADFLAR